MKKYITFSNFIALLGIMTILFYLIPAVTVTSNDQTAIEGTNINLFIATFGGSFTISFGEFIDPATYALRPCAGLVVGFILLIVAIILSVLKMKNKFATLLAMPFYIATGSLVICAAKLLRSTNIGAGMGPAFKFINIGGVFVVSIFCFILGGLALVDFIGTIAKPKTQPVNPAI